MSEHSLEGSLRSTIDFLGNKYLISGSGTYELNGNFVVAYEMKDATTKNTYQTGTHTFIKK